MNQGDPIPFQTKTCGCGRVYDEASWTALPPPGKGRDTNGRVDMGPDGIVEWRDCPCGNTMMRTVFEGQEEQGS